MFKKNWGKYNLILPNSLFVFLESWLVRDGHEAVAG